MQSEYKVNEPLEIKFKLDPGAVLPTKAHPDDVGYDLTAIRSVKRIGEHSVMLGTGVYAAPPTGYYLEVVPRSSLAKTGFMLANSVGIIDPSYRGEILIVVTNFVPNVVVQFPFNRFQLILRRQYISKTLVVDFLDETERGAGGFGSTDSKST